MDDTRLENYLVVEHKKNQLLQAAYARLDLEVERDFNLHHRMLQATGLGEIDAQNLNGNKIYPIHIIKKVAIEQRLRFLPFPYFKQELPRFAFDRIQELAQDHPEIEHSLYILAPEKLFKVVDCNDDPVLFAQTRDGTFYLIASWGKDLQLWRKWLTIPLRNLQYAAASTIAVGTAIGLCIPTDWIFPTTNPATVFPLKMLCILTVVCTLSAIFSYFFISRSSGFSSQNWNSRYFNFKPARNTNLNQSFN